MDGLSFLDFCSAGVDECSRFSTSDHMRRGLSTTSVMRLHRCLFRDAWMSQPALRQAARDRIQSFSTLERSVRSIEDFHFRSSLRRSCFASTASLESHPALPLPPGLLTVRNGASPLRAAPTTQLEISEVVVDVKGCVVEEIRLQRKRIFVHRFDVAVCHTTLVALSHVWLTIYFSSQLTIK